MRLSERRILVPFLNGTKILLQPSSVGETRRSEAVVMNMSCGALVALAIILTLGAITQGVDSQGIFQPLSKDAYRSAFVQSSSRSLPDESASNSASPRGVHSIPPESAAPNATFKYKVIFIPSFQATLLEHCAPSSRASCELLHLCPLTAHSVDAVYDKLVSSDTRVTDRVEYATCACAPPPYSHQAHCNVLPALHSHVSRLRSELLRLSVNMRAVRYDWRLRADAIVSRYIVPELASIGSTDIVLAHGTSCTLVARYVRHDQVFICAFPLSNGSASAALSTGSSDMVRTGDAHVYLDAKFGDNVHNTFVSDVDSGISARRLRHVAPALVDGPWGRGRRRETDGEKAFAASKERRKELFGKIDFVREYAEKDDRVEMKRGQYKHSVCIQRLSARNCARLFAGADEVSTSSSDDMYDLSASVVQVISKLIDGGNL